MKVVKGGGRGTWGLSCGVAGGCDLSYVHFPARIMELRLWTTRGLMRVYHRTVKRGRNGGRDEDGEEGKSQEEKRRKWR